jgi:taurine--2-oxoglutarate transaminase
VANSARTTWIIWRIIQYEGPETIAAILVETVTGTNGVIIPPEGYLTGVRDICDRHGILLIADEVMSGFGRTGKWFAVDHWNVIPDLMTMAKGLTSAYAPLGAVAMKPEIAAHFNEMPFRSGLTYTSHPVSLAAAIANINVLKQDRLIEHAAAMGPVLRRMLNDLGEAHPSVGEVRSIGLFGIIELVRDRATKEPMAPWNSSGPEMGVLHCLNTTLSRIHWHTVLIIPLIITEEQLQDGFHLMRHSITDKAAGK